jgi:putative flippase GtrA
MTKLRAILLRQILRFGVVGLAATAIHAAIYYQTTVAHALLRPVRANAAGFAAAFTVSFLGHRYWTFAHRNAAWARSLVKFLVTALLGFGCSMLITWTMVERLQLPAVSALWGIVLITPALVFVCSKWWAFAVSVPASSVPPAGRGR